jgi:[ribosomal protein S5]-alanine N-acetyltransferase
MKYLVENIESKRILFRKIEAFDFDTWIDFFKDPKSFEHWVGNYESPETECANWYKKQFDRYNTNGGGMNALIEKATGQLIGHAGLLLQTVDEKPEWEVAYSLLPAFRGKGFATEAALKCIEYAFRNNLTDRVISIISLSNHASANVAKKNGMKAEKQTWYNQNRVTIFRILKMEYEEKYS